MKLRIRESNETLAQQAELAILRMAGNQNELKFAQKIIDGIKSGKCTESNFYDFISKLAKNVRSDRAIRGYQIIADYAFDRVFGEGRHQDDWSRKPKSTTVSQRHNTETTDKIYVAKLDTSAGDIVYVKNDKRKFGDVQLGSDMCLSPSFTGEVKRGGVFIYNDDVYSSKDRAFSKCLSPDDIIKVIESGEVKPIAVLVNITDNYFEIEMI